MLKNQHWIRSNRDFYRGKYFKSKETKKTQNWKNLLRKNSINYSVWIIRMTEKTSCRGKLMS